MNSLDRDLKEEIKDIVYDFFAEECEVDKSELVGSTRIVEDLDGDSLMIVELSDVIKTKYNKEIPFEDLSKTLISSNWNTIDDVINTVLLMCEK